jgi:flagellin
MANVDVTRIASNIGALNALNSLQGINAKLALHQTRLSTGKRINSAMDDPAGLTIATKMLARSEGLRATLDNISDAKNMLSVAEGGMSKMTDIIIQMRNKAEQAASDTLGASERATIQTQLSSYAQQIQDIVDQTKWNGVKLLDINTGTKQFQTGVDEGENTTWSMTSNLAPAGLALSTNQIGDDITVNASDGGFAGVAGGSEEVVQAGALGNMTKLTTGGYGFEVLGKATDATHGYTTPSGALLTGVSGLSTAQSGTSALYEASGHFRVTINSIDNTADTVSLKIENLDDSTWGSNGTGSITNTQSVADAATSIELLDADAGSRLGVALSLTSTRTGLVAGQSMEFEYIKQGQAKIELNDGSGVAMQIAKNATGTQTGQYAYVTADNATDYSSGRGATIRLAAVANVDVGDEAEFTFKADNRYLVDVSSASKAAAYMTTTNNALDKVTSALSDLGSLMARLSFKEESTTVAQVNVEGAYNRIMNANMAEEQVNASKYTILQQTATAMLAQANAAPQSLLALFR